MQYRGDCSLPEPSGPLESMDYSNIWSSELKENHAVNAVILNHECPLAPAIGALLRND
jgi:hypothetical protein